MTARCSKCDFWNLGKLLIEQIKNIIDENVLSKILWSNFFSIKFFWSPIPILNFPKIPKITLRTACDHFKNTNSAHEKKTVFFPTI